MLHGQWLGAKDELVRAETALSDIDREVARAEREVDVVIDRERRDTERLRSGQGSAKDLQATQHELESLARRRAALEETQLEVMERQESAAAAVTAAKERVQKLAVELRALLTERDRRWADIDSEAAQITQQRPGVVAGLPAELIALYVKLRADHNGVGAALLRARRCEGCRLELNASDLGVLRSTAPETVVQCEECRRILVRTAESGL